MPPEGAATPSVIVPLGETPPVTLAGAMVKAVTETGKVTVTEAEAVKPPADAVNVIVDDCFTTKVVIGKVTEL